MCQFNIVFVRNAESKKILKDYEYNSFGDDINNFSPFVKGICNCNSFVGSMSEYNGNSYLEMLESSKQAKLANKYKKDYNNFLEYKKLFEKLLENEDYILFSCIWDEPGEMITKKDVNIKNLTIEDLASLEFDEMIKIYK